MRALLVPLVQEMLPQELQTIWARAADEAEAYTREQVRAAGKFYAPLPGAGDR